MNGENYTDVPDSCCHEYSKGCGSKVIIVISIVIIIIIVVVVIIIITVQSFQKLILPLRKQDKLGIWTNACIDILKVT